MRRAFESSNWIWPLKEQFGKNEYADFVCIFKSLTFEKALLRICAKSDYAAWMNGKLIGFNQYRDFPDEKVYDEYDLNGFLRYGENRFAVKALSKNYNSFSHIADGKGIIGINAMVAAREFLGLLHTAINEGIDLVVAGAGFSRDMFSLGKQSGTAIVPIVATAKLAKISQSLGAAAVVVEGKEAGGHLGTDLPMRMIVPEIKKNLDIPVIAAGGIISGQDIVDTLKLGADGVQMGSRFAASCEANGAPALKEFYLKI